MKRLILTGFVTGLTALTLSALPAFGDNTVTVSAKVTVASACLTVSPQSIDFGTMPFPTSGTFTPQGGNALQQPTLTNCGVADETVYARGTDAVSSTSTAKWTLIDYSVWASPGGTNLYTLALLENSGFTLSLTTTNAQWRALSGGATDTHSVGIQMPRTGSDGAGETMTMQVVYTASL